MDRIILRDLAVFETVARHRSFTAAAAELGLSQSAISYAVGQLEQRLGVALLARTTRSVAPTEAGKRLLGTLVPALGSISDELSMLQNMRETISGTVRLTMTRVCYDEVLRPILGDFLDRHRGIHLDLSIDDGLNDPVADGFDGGIRFGNLVAKDMVALPLTKASPISIVGAPDYLRAHGAPQTPEDLKQHRCLGYRFASSRLHRWTLGKNGQWIRFRPETVLVLNDGEAIRMAALDGLGLAYVFSSQVADDIAAGRLLPVLEAWLPDLPGFSLYYPGARQTSPAFRALIEHLRGATAERS
ncbi:LysR family transcriptional regulator [Halotalea alkalilenta]|uniref:LysR family transcriptional regulator n=1 Tax=Halotalea alkalilenta TaxID=376489 RepID=A0A172YG67_9GAMM|nr:LysR family transcriptional regulator [Halotalea alkalilenta]ANF58271.1 LysR family transcriptional regulator [Halotalea alkalilenta]